MNFNYEKMVIRTRERTNFYRKSMTHFLRFMVENDVKFLNQSKRWRFFDFQAITLFIVQEVWQRCPATRTFNQRRLPWLEIPPSKGPLGWIKPWHNHHGWTKSIFETKIILESLVESSSIEKRLSSLSLARQKSSIEAIFNHLNHSKSSPKSQKWLVVQPFGHSQGGGPSVENRIPFG